MVEASNTEEPATARAVSRLIVWMVAIAAVVRGLLWYWTFPAIGPVSGVAFWYLSGGLYTGMWVTIEIALIVVVLTTAAVVAVGVRRDFASYRVAARVLGWVLFAQTVFYLLPPLAFVLYFRSVADSVWFDVGLGAVTLANVAVAVLGPVIAWRARPARLTGSAGGSTRPGTGLPARPAGTPG